MLRTGIVTTYLKMRQVLARSRNVDVCARGVPSDSRYLGHFVQALVTALSAADAALRLGDLDVLRIQLANRHALPTLQVVECQRILTA